MRKRLRDIDSLIDSLDSLHIVKKPKVTNITKDSPVTPASVTDGAPPPPFESKFKIPLTHAKTTYTKTDVENLITEREDILYTGYLDLINTIGELKERVHFLEKELALERRGCGYVVRREAS